MTGLRESKRTLAWLLSALVVVGSGSQPGYCHSHAGGEVEHHHVQASEPRHVNSHDHGHSHAHYHGNQDHSKLSPTSPHQHVTLLGFSWTLPIENSGSEPQNSDRHNLTCVCSLNQTCICLTSSDSAGSRVLVDNWTSTIDCGKSCRRLIEPSQQRPAFLLLCDTARHERSGVQLF